VIASFSKVKWVVLTMCFSSAGSFAETPVSECNIERGERIIQKCTACHTFDAKGAHGVGPNLYHLLGRAVGQVDGFQFSSSLRKSGDIWSVELLDSFLESPMQVYPGTRMAFGGLKKSEDRSALICYLSTSR
jgi:cytochrome c